MSHFHSVLLCRRRGVALAALLFLAATAGAQDVASTPAPGRIDFAAANLPPATVEVDLGQGMFRDLFGIGDAAVAGVAETLAQSAGTDKGSEGTKLAAEELAAVRDIIQLASGLVREVRVRVYDSLPDQAGKPEELISQYDEQLRTDNWDKIVRVRDGDDTVGVSLLRDEGAIRGVFVAVASGHEFVLANVVCDVSPENVKKLTSMAAKIGLDNGLQPMIEAKMKELHRRLPPAPPRP